LFNKIEKKIKTNQIKIKEQRNSKKRKLIENKNEKEMDE
jgi:hypothetical protein